MSSKVEGSEVLQAEAVASTTKGEFLEDFLASLEVHILPLLIFFIVLLSHSFDLVLLAIP